MVHEGRLVFEGSVAELEAGGSLDERFYALAGGKTKAPAKEAS
jgi:hypothetical protein